MIWFWDLFCYSFFGFLLEVVYAHLTGGRRERKCMLLPLCPVYGVGALLILELTAGVRQNPALVCLLGAGAATLAEYGMALWYEWLGVRFWDYSRLPGNFRGRICLPFSVAWGVLSLGLVYAVEPRLSELFHRIPMPVSVAAMTLFVTDALVSSVILRSTQDIRYLRWTRASCNRAG